MVTLTPNCYLPTLGMSSVAIQAPFFRNRRGIFDAILLTKISFKFMIRKYMNSIQVKKLESSTEGSIGKVAVEPDFQWQTCFQVLEKVILLKFKMLVSHWEELTRVASQSWGKSVGTDRTEGLTKSSVECESSMAHDRIQDIEFYDQTWVILWKKMLKEFPSDFSKDHDKPKPHE